MAFKHLPNEVIAQIFQFLSFTFLSSQISIVSRRFAEISQLVLFSDNAKTKRNWKELDFYRDHFYLPENGFNIPSIPNVAPPADWNLRIKKFYFESVDYRQEQILKEFIKFLAESGQVQHCKIDLGECCTELSKFDFDLGYFSSMRGKVLQMTVNHFTVDDFAYKSHGHSAPFSHPFLLEIPQLILHLDNLVDCEKEKGIGDNLCGRLDVAEWLGTPLPQNSNYVRRKAFMHSSRVENVTGLVGLIALNYLRSTQPCPFDVFINFVGHGNLGRFLPTQPNIHSITGEILQIRPYNPNGQTDGEQRKFVIRRCMADKIGIEPTFYSTEKSCLFQFY